MISHRAKVSRSPWDGWLTIVRTALASPLLHFFVLGGLAFGYYGLENPSSGRPARNDTLRLSEAEAERLVVEFTSARRRPPEPQEFAGLVRDWAIEEASVREAVALGLDQGDAMIRNRLRSKIEFLADAPAAALSPDEATLAAYYRDNAARYGLADMLSFEQVLLPAGANLGEIEALKARLAQGADPGGLGQSTLLPPQVAEMDEPGIESIFGKGFGAEVAALPLGRWEGPLQSSYGLHLVRLEMRREGSLLPLEKVRARVLADWRADEGRKMREAYFDNLLQHFTVELPIVADSEKP